MGTKITDRGRLPRQDLDLQRQAHRRRRQLGWRPVADDNRPRHHEVTDTPYGSAVGAADDRGSDKRNASRQRSKQSNTVVSRRVTTTPASWGAARAEKVAACR